MYFEGGGRALRGESVFTKVAPDDWRHNRALSTGPYSDHFTGSAPASDMNTGSYVGGIYCTIDSDEFPLTLDLRACSLFLWPAEWDV